MLQDGQGLSGQAEFTTIDEIVKDKFHLLNHGIELSDEAKNVIGNATIQYGLLKGIAGGIDLILPGDVHVSAPINPTYTSESNYGISVVDSKLVLTRDGKQLYPVRYIPAPDFLEKKAADGTKLSKFGKIYTDRLGISVVKGCKYALVGKGCRFCEIGTQKHISLNSLAGVRELIDYCEASPSITFRHILLTGGCGFSEMWEEQLRFVAGIASFSTRPIYYMTTPVPKEKLTSLHNNGVVEIGMNIELWDRTLARRYMPGKGLLEREIYLKALGEAVSRFGSSGQVRSILIVGLEPIENTLHAIHELARMKVMPILSPFRALQGTPMQGMREPAAELLYEVWHRGQQICERHGMTLGPLCKACQNNTITAPVTTAYRYY